MVIKKKKLDFAELEQLNGGAGKTKKQEEGRSYQGHHYSIGKKVDPKSIHAGTLYFRKTNLSTMLCMAKTDSSENYFFFGTPRIVADVKNVEDELAPIINTETDHFYEAICDE